MPERGESDQSRFAWEPGDWKEWLCGTCIHWKDGRVCAAYPNGMPDEIWNGDVDHRRPYPGDRGIQYKGKS